MRNNLEVSNMTTAMNENSAYQIKLKKKPVYDLISRIIDIYLSFVALVFSIPILLLTALAIKIEDRGPIFYTQKRVGKNGKEFTMYKVRSMCIDSDKKGSSETEANDSRITKVGRFIRKTRIDEIPQLWNIYTGDMKIIGPRPLVPDQIEEFSKELPEFRNRLAVYPGLTGLAQVSGGNELNPGEKLAFDMEYVERRGARLDLKIVIRTVMVVFSGDGAR